MVHPLFRLAAFAAPLLMAGTALAQDGGTGVATLAEADLALRIQFPEGAALSAFNLERFFNKARCDCNETAFVFVGLTPAGLARKPMLSRDGTMQIFIGANCSTTVLTERARTCKELGKLLIGDFLNIGTVTVPVTAQEMSTDATQLLPDGTQPQAFTPNTSCTLEKKDHAQTIYVVLDTNNDSTPDQGGFSTSVKIDLEPPPPPTLPAEAAQGGHQAVTISWTPVDLTTNRDLIGYQVLCNRAGEFQVFPDGTFDPGYASCATNPGMGAEGLHPNFICSPLLAPSTSSFRVKILQNDIIYGVGVASIDKSGNASVPDIFYARAEKTNSFYDVYRDCYNGTTDNQCVQGSASGGMCTLLPGQAVTWSALTLAGVLAAAAATIVRRRRRR